MLHQFIMLQKGYHGDNDLFSFCNDVLLGFALMRGRDLMKIQI